MKLDSNRVFRHVVGVVVMTVALASSAHAQYRAGSSVEITPFAGYYIASDIWTYQVSVPIENSFMYGGRLTWNPSLRGGIEFAYTRAESEVKSPRNGQFYGTSKIGDLTFDSFDINFLGYQPTGNSAVTPFASFGFGWSTVHRDIGIDSEINNVVNGSSTLFNFNFALGTKVYVSDRAGLRLEGRWRTTDTNINTNDYYWCDIYGYCYSYGTSWYSSWELVGGLTYRLGQ